MGCVFFTENGVHIFLQPCLEYFSVYSEKVWVLCNIFHCNPYLYQTILPP